MITERYCSICGRRLAPHDEDRYTCNTCIKPNEDIKPKVMEKQEEKHKYAVKVLEANILHEQRQLKRMSECNNIPQDQKDHHMSGYTHRIEKLKEAIEELKNVK